MIMSSIVSPSQSRRGSRFMLRTLSMYSCGMAMQMTAVPAYEAGLSTRTMRPLHIT